MMNNKLLRWNFVYQYGYTVTNILNAIILLPIYVEHIPPSVLGIWWATGNILAWLTMTDPGIGDILQQKISEAYGAVNLPILAKLKGAGLLTGLIVFFATIVMGFLVTPFLYTILKQPVHDYPDVVNAFSLSVLSTAISLFSFVVVGVNQGLQESKVVAISYVAGNIIYFFSSIIFLSVLDLGVLAIAYSNIIRACFITMINLFCAKGLPFFKDISFDWTFTRKFSRIFYHTASARIGGTLASNLDLILISRSLSPLAITIFEINRRPLKLLQGLIGRYSVALMPSISTLAGRSAHDEKRDLITHHFVRYMFVVLIVCCGLLVIGPFTIAIWVGESKFVGNDIWIYLCASSFFGLISYYVSNVLFATGDIKGTSNVTIVRSFSYLLVTVAGLRLNGLLGMVIAQLLNVLVVDTLFLAYRLAVSRCINLEVLKNTLPSILAFCLLTFIFCVSRSYYLAALTISNAVIVGASFGFAVLVFSLIVQRRFWLI